MIYKVRVDRVAYVTFLNWNFNLEEEYTFEIHTFVKIYFNGEYLFEELCEKSVI